MTQNSMKNEDSARPSASGFLIKSAVTGIAVTALLASSGCATSSLLDSDSGNRTHTTTVKQALSEDQIIAFGRPAQALPNMPSATMVIVGNKNSYVLTEGGAEMVRLLTNLTPQNIQVNNDMSFEVPNNDGYFQGQMQLSYAKLKDEFKRGDYQFFLQNSGQECSSASDLRMNAQRFCFNVPVKGAIYPPVSNLGLIQSQYRPLSKPYTVSFYSQMQKSEVTRSGKSGAEKLILLPFAVAFDVVTFPVQLLDSIAN